MAASFVTTGYDVPESRNLARLSLFESSRGVVTLPGVIRACVRHPWNPQGPGWGQVTSWLLAAAAMGRDDPHDRGILAVLSNSRPSDPWSTTRSWWQRLVRRPLTWPTAFVCLEAVLLSGPIRLSGLPHRRNAAATARNGWDHPQMGEDPPVWLKHDLRKSSRTGARQAAAMRHPPVG